MTLTEDLVLLLLDPARGRAVVDGTSLDRAIGGALLLDLAAGGRITADGDGAKARLSVAVPTPSGDPLLDAALGRLTKPMKAQKAVERLARGTRAQVLERLAERGLVRRESSRILGLIPVTTWVPGEGARELRGRVTAVLRDGARPDQHLALLISLVHAVKAEHKVVDGNKRELRARAAQVAEGEWAGHAVRKAVEAVQASVMAAVVASTVAASASSASGG